MNNHILGQRVTLMGTVHKLIDKNYVVVKDGPTIPEDEYEVQEGPRQIEKGVQFILRDKAGQTYHCKVRDHFPVRIHDIVYGSTRVESIRQKVKNRWQEILCHEFISTPFTLVGRTKEALTSRLYGMLPKKYHLYIPQIYDQLVSTGQYRLKNTIEHEAAFEQLCYMSDLYRNYNEDKVNNMFPNLTGKVILDLLRKWYWGQVRRRIELLGVPRSAIYPLIEVGYRMYKIYHMIMKDAFTVVSIDMDSAVKLKRSLGQKYTQQDKIAAEAARDVFIKNRTQGWSGAPAANYGHCIDQLLDVYEMITEDGTIYFPRQYEKETIVMKSLLNQMNIAPPLKAEVTEDSTKTDYIALGNRRITLEHREYGLLDRDQQQAVQGALSYPVSVITGPPGVGKTTIIEQIADNLEEWGIPCVICAYTGKAVARIAQAVQTRIKPMTIHKLCSVRPYFKHLIIDEASMITTELMSMIYERFDSNFTLTLIGDINQLPPIDWGFVFREVIDAGIFPVYTLTINHRIVVDGKENIILSNIQNIVKLIEAQKAQSPNYMQLYNSFILRSEHNFTLLPGGMDDLLELVKKLSTTHSDMDIALITPFNRHVSLLNDLCQNLFITDKSTSLINNGHTYYPGTIVMMTRNDYGIDIMNGTIGRLINFFVEDRPAEIAINNWGNNGVSPFRSNYHNIVPSNLNVYHYAEQTGYMQLEVKNE